MWLENRTLDLKTQVTFYSEFVLDPAESLQLVTEFKGRQNGIATRQRYQRRTGQCPVGVDSRQRVSQAVLGVTCPTLGAAAPDVVRLCNRVSTVQEQLDNLIAVPLCRQHQRRDVGRER